MPKAPGRKRSSNKNLRNRPEVQATEDTNTSLPSSNSNNNRVARSERQNAFQGMQPPSPAMPNPASTSASSVRDRVIVVERPTRITRKTAIACDLCYNAHRKVLPFEDPTHNTSVRRRTEPPRVNRSLAQIVQKGVFPALLRGGKNRRRIRNPAVNITKIGKILKDERPFPLYQPWGLTFLHAGRTISLKSRPRWGLRIC